MIDMAVGNPTNPSYIPIEYLNLGQRMSFIERVYNTLFLCVTLTIFHHSMCGEISIVPDSLIWPPLDAWRMSHVSEALAELLELPEEPNLVSKSFCS